MSASAIFAISPHPLCLEKNLWEFVTQSYRDFEIIVAEEVSVPATCTEYGIENVHLPCTHPA